MFEFCIFCSEISRAVRGGDVGGEVPAAGGQVGAGLPGEGVQTVTLRFIGPPLLQSHGVLSV